MFIKKTIIMNGLQSKNEKAVLNIEKNQDGFKGNVRLYNFKAEPLGILTLGCLVNEKVIKAGLTKKSDKYYEFASNEGIESERFVCSIIQITKGSGQPILIGASDGGVSKAELKLTSAIEVLDVPLTVKNVSSVLSQNKIEMEEEDELEEMIDKNFDEGCHKCEGGSCTSCEYRKAFYNQTDEKMSAIRSDSIDFFHDIKEQLSQLFEKYPAEEFLPTIFPNSKWAKVDFNKDGNYYVVGVIYEEDRVKYICYGVPAIWEETPPADLQGFSQWLPLDTDKPHDFGYWICYQDAETGDNIQMDIV